MGLVDGIVDYIRDRRQVELLFALSQRAEAQEQAERLARYKAKGEMDYSDWGEALQKGVIPMPDMSSAPAGMQYPARVAQQYGPRPERIGMLQRIRDRMNTTRENMKRGGGYLYGQLKNPFKEYAALRPEMPGSPLVEGEQLQPREYMDPNRPRYY